MNYLCNKKVFKTLKEANAYANDILRTTKEVLIITETKRKVTHIFNF